MTDITNHAIAGQLIAAIRALPDTPVTGHQPDGDGSHAYAAWCETCLPGLSAKDCAWCVSGLALALAEATEASEET